MDALERHLAQHDAVLRRYVRYRISNTSDAQDVLQEILVAAAIGFASLPPGASIKPWLIGIAVTNVQITSAANTGSMKSPSPRQNASPSFLHALP